MRHMAVGHDQAVIANNGLAFCSSATVDRYKFANGGIVANYCSSFLTLEFEILRHSTNHSTGEDSTVFTDTRTLHDSYIATDASAFADLHILIDGDKRINNYARSNLCCGMHIC